MYQPVPGIEPMSSEFLDKCVTRHSGTSVKVWALVPIQQPGSYSGKFTALTLCGSQTHTDVTVFY